MDSLVIHLDRDFHHSPGRRLSLSLNSPFSSYFFSRILRLATPKHTYVGIFHLHTQDTPNTPCNRCKDLKNKNKKNLLKRRKNEKKKCLPKRNTRDSLSLPAALFYRSVILTYARRFRDDARVDEGLTVAVGAGIPRYFFFSRACAPHLRHCQNGVTSFRPIAMRYSPTVALLFALQPCHKQGNAAWMDPPALEYLGSYGFFF